MVFSKHTIASVSGTTLTFSTAPANTRVVTVYHARSSISGSNMIVDTMTGDNSDVTLTLSVAPVSENNVQVYFDGVYQSKANYSISGTTLTFSTAPATGVAVEAITHTQTTINEPAANTVTPAKIAAGDFYFDTDTLYIDATNNKVGIGTSSPGSYDGILNLETSSPTIVNYNSTNANGGFIKFQRSGTTKGYVGTPAAFLGGGDADDFGIRAQADFTIATGGANESLRIDSTGNVLIGQDSGDAFNADAMLRLQRAGDRVFQSFKVDADQEASIFFGDVDDDIECGITYEAANQNLIFKTGNNAEAMHIDSSGNLLVGQTTANSGTVGTSLRADGRTFFCADGNYAAHFNRNTSDGAIAHFAKDDSMVGSIGVYSGSLFIAGNSTQNTGIRCYSAGIAPCTNTGGYIDNARDLGAASVRWDDVYATNGTIQTSDRNEKQDIAELTDAETRVAVAAKGLLRKFRWQSAVEEKGDEARIHFGIIAQDLQDAFTAEGLDAGDYAMFISDTWTDDDGVEQTRLGVRYSELLAFIIAAI